MTISASEYAKNREPEFVEQLKDLLRIPSISTLTTHKSYIERAAEWLRDHCLAIGMTRAEIYPTPGHPIVYAEWLGAGKAAPTLLVYGHYDVQPVDGVWNQEDPFEPVERGGNLYARGATDDKGQLFVHLKAFDAIMKATGSFPMNFKVMFEGEEEIASVHLNAFIEKHLDMLMADVVVISDNHIQGIDDPSIIYGLRGLTYMEIEVTGPNHDLHSGAYGGAVHNPALALVQILTRMHDEQGHILVPGFYDEVVPLTDEERKALSVVPFTEAMLKAQTGADKLWGEPEFTARERIGARPTLEINGIWGGWTGEGQKTIIPAKATAKVSCRLVANQNPKRIYELVKAYVARITPDTVRSEVRLLSTGDSALVPLDSEAMQVAVEAYEAVFGKKPTFMREGGSIPVVATYNRLMKAPVVMMGFGLPDDNLHAPNEKITLKMFHRGIQTMIHFYQNLPKRFGK